MPNPPAAPHGLRLELLAARQGDAILVDWGSDDDRHRMLVDGGPAPAYEEISERLSRLPGKAIDLAVLTHIDGDHIEGTILLINDMNLDLAIGDIWFNGSHHLVGELGPVHGEILGALVAGRGVSWNGSFGNAAVCSDREEGPLPVVELPAGLRVTVLAPDRAGLRRLRDAWIAACKEAGLEFGSPAAALAALQTRPQLSPRSAYLSRQVPDVRALARARRGTDRSVANASSIVLLLEHGAERALLAGDSTPAALIPGITRLLAERDLEALPLTYFKLPHHGSANNVTQELIRRLPAGSYLFSSDGSYFNHPDDAAVATVIEFAPPGCQLVFNYDNPRTRQWDNPQLQEQYGYRVCYPDGPGGVAVTWEAGA